MTKHGRRRELGQQFAIDVKIMQVDKPQAKFLRQGQHLVRDREDVDQRLVVVLNYYLDLPPAVIADHLDIPVGTAFQYRCTGTEPLRFLCISMPPWPGDSEATLIEGPWVPTAPDSPESLETET